LVQRSLWSILTRYGLLVGILSLNLVRSVLTTVRCAWCRKIFDVDGKSGVPGRGARPCRRSSEHRRRREYPECHDTAHCRSETQVPLILLGRTRILSCSSAGCRVHRRVVPSRLWRPFLASDAPVKRPCTHSFCRPVRGPRHYAPFPHGQV
jgi:hypothetical protein